MPPLVMVQQVAPTRGILRITLLLALLGGATWGCPAPDPAAQAVDRSIQRHGGEIFDEMDVRFTFRGVRFTVIRDHGRFRYERSYRDDQGRLIREILSNEGPAAEVNGEPVPLDARERERIETAVNSVVYFGFLPFRLRDPAVRLRDLGEARIGDEPYRKVEVTFREEGGGPDWDDRFVYWFHRDEHTLDYLAYRYHRDGGGTRFRRAVNRREVGGLLIQDYENFTGIDPVEDIADYDRLLEEERLRLVSMIELEDVVVNQVSELAPDEGFEVRVGIDRSSYGPGEPITASIALINATDRERGLSFATARRYDFVLLDRDDRTRFRWSDGQGFAQVLGREVLSPGARLEWTETFPAPSRPGRFLLQGQVVAREGSLEATVPVEVR